MSPPSFRLLCFAIPVLSWAATTTERPFNPLAANDPIEITSVNQAFTVWPELTRDDVRIRLEGVVTATMPNGAFRMHDGHLGIYAAKSALGQTVMAGDRIAVSGLMRRGGFSPWFTPQQLQILGKGEFPKPSPADYGMLASGAADNQWLEIEGVVRATQLSEGRDFVVLDLGMTGGNLRVLVNYDPSYNFADLIDAEVRIRGVGAVNSNAHKQAVEPSFRVPSFSQISVLQPGNPEPFTSAPVPVDRLLRFSPGKLYQHRTHTRGVVTRRLSDTVFFLRGNGAGLKVETNTPCSFRPGEVVDVSGFPAMDQGIAVIQHALHRASGAVSEPAAAQPTLESVLDGNHISDLIQFRARLIDWVIAGRNVTLLFQTGDHFFKGVLNLPSHAKLNLPAENSIVNVTGICVISEVEDVWFYQPRAFLMLVADQADVQLVRPPPWWTPERLQRALAVACVVLLAAAGWVWALRRQIERKRAVIEQQARHAAALEERNRIARELHDTLEQGLTGLSLQMKAMENDVGAPAHIVRDRLQITRQMLRQSRALARNAIRELRTETEPAAAEGLIDGLKRVADSWNFSGALVATVQVIGTARPLPPRIEHHLLNIATEAMTNAVKHGRASAIRATISFHPAQVSVEVSDDGVGFDAAQQMNCPSGCFGLVGMRERAREIGGELKIESDVGHGTRVLVTLSQRTRDAHAASKRDVALSTEPFATPAA